jgi:hypothetical protein
VRTVTRTLLTAGVMLLAGGPAAAQRPEGIRPAALFITADQPPPPFPGAARSPVAVTERLMSFDANKDQQISRDELPDRMQALIARGDKNADGALDVNEIRALVTAASSERIRVSFRPQASEGLPGVISDLKLSPAKREQGLGILGAHKLTVPVKDPANSDLYKAMRSLLDDEEYENFVAAAERLTKTAQFGKGIASGVVGGAVGGVVGRSPDR